MKSVLFINRVYPPLDGATGQLLAELAPSLAKAGWQVTVVTGGANEGAVRSEVLDGVRVERVAGLPFTRASHFRRALSYLSLYPALFCRAARLSRHDVVVTLTDPPMQAVCGVVLAALRKTRHVHWAQDVYPELAEEMGVLKKGGLVAGLLRRLSTWALRKSDGIVAVGRCMQARLVSRRLGSSTISVIPNWGQSIVSCCYDQPSQSFRRDHDWLGRFVVMYSGNLGLAHSFDAILDSAALLQASKPEVLFVFVGDGSRLPWVKQQVVERYLANVQFLPFQPKEQLTELLASADVHLACMRNELCGLVVPSKVYGILTAGRPCVFLGPEDSEAARLLRELGGGTVLSEATGDSLAHCLAAWAANPQRMAQVREDLRAVGARVGVEQAARLFDELFGRVLGNQRVEAALDSRAANRSAAVFETVQLAGSNLAFRDFRRAKTELNEAPEKQDAA
jgi:colanic acid biosynthesis glycosyl transferase WcaI